MKRNASWMGTTNHLNFSSTMDSLWSVKKLLTACSDPISYQSVAIDDVQDPTFEDSGILRLHASNNKKSFRRADENNLQQCRIPSSECITTKSSPLENEYGGNNTIQRSLVNCKNRAVSISNRNLNNALETVRE